MQAGVSWHIILRKREALRRAFDGFDPQVVAGYGPDRLETLMADPGITTVQDVPLRPLPPGGDSQDSESGMVRVTPQPL